MERDVILVAFACSAQAPCQTWAKKYFSEEPLVLNVPGGGGSAFRAKAIAWAKTGDAFRAALDEMGYKNVTIKRRGLVTFSVGWSFADELLKFQDEIDKLDAYLLLDGCHTSNLSQWNQMATKAANAQAWMTMAHSSIVPPSFPSSTTTNNAMFNSACEANDNQQDQPKMETNIPDYVSQAVLPDSGITVSLGSSPGMSASQKHWTQDSLIASCNRGYLTLLGYSGDAATDHVYIAWYVAERLWKWFGEVWS